MEDLNFEFSSSMKIKMLNNQEIREVEKVEAGETMSSPQGSPHRDPNQYNGEVLDSQKVNPNSTKNKTVYIESYVC